MGFMWLGTSDGLNKYDGNGFTVYRHNPSNPNTLSGNSIWTIYEDSSGDLWVSSWMYGLNKFSRENETFTRYAFHQDTGANSEIDVVYSICEDTAGMLWIALYQKGIRVLDRGGKTTYSFTHDPKNPNSLSGDNPKIIYKDRSGTMWIGNDQGLNRFNPKTKTFTLFPIESGAETGDARNILTQLFDDSKKQLWIGTAVGGVYTFDREKEMFDKNTGNTSQMCKQYMLSICEDQNGLIWIGTLGDGLSIFNPGTRKVTRYSAFPDNPGSLNDDQIYCVYRDRSDLIWLGTRGRGINLFDRNKRKFAHYKNIPGDSNSLSINSVWSFYEDRFGILWIGTKKGGLNRFDRKTNRYTTYRYSSISLPHSEEIYAILEDHAGELWLGTNCCLKKFDRQKETFTNYPCHVNTPHGVSSNYIYTIKEDRDGVLWMAAANGGVNTLDRERKNFTHYKNNPDNPSSLGSNFVLTVYIDRSNVPWIGTEVAGLNQFDRKTKAFIRYPCTNGSPNGLNCSFINSIYEDNAGNLWLGTNGGGLNRFNRQNKTFTHYTTDHGLPNNIIFGILEDNSGNLWLSTNKGICRFNPSTGETKNFVLRDGIQDYEFNGGAYYKNREGVMFFGGEIGFNSFSPKDIHDIPHIPPIVFTGFKISDKPVNIGKNSFLRKHINLTREITLPYNVSNFSLSFAALDFANPRENRYRYKIDELNQDWIELGNNHYIMFAKMAPGEYTLRVSGSNTDGIWNNEGAVITLIIKPPSWKTWWFQLLVILALGALLYILHKQRMKNLYLQLKTEAEIENILSPYNISAREKEIIRLIIRGKSNKDIEDALYISIKTVKSHIYNIYQKLGVKNRLELIHLIQKSIK